MDELAATLKARGLVGKVGSSAIPAPIEAYVAEIGAVLHYDSDLGPDESGMSFTRGSKHYICVNAKESAERQRFTVCHEIAHIVLGLPSEHGAAPAWSYASRSPNEILCDVFAAELLLPSRIFKPLAEKMEIGLAAIDELAGRFEASFTATGSRFATVLAAPSAFVLSEQGKVRYASRSTALREANAWIPPRSVLPAGSVSERIRRGIACDGAEEIAADLWITDWDRGGTLLEEARHLARWDQTLALLWFEDEEVPSPPRDEYRKRNEEGLPELDGVLPWPGRKRRK